ncbi:MAG: flagellar brake protein [Halanaerobiaceae bacterium]
MIEQLKINDKVDIQVDSGPYQGKYLSKVAEIDNDTIKVTSPFIKGEVVPLRIGQVVKLYFTGDTAAFTFTAKVLDRQIDPVAILTLKKTSELKRIQRREYFRIEAKKEVKYRIIEDPLNIDGDESADLERSETLDISGGGIKLLVDDDFPREGFVELYIDIPDIEEMPILGKVVNDYNLGDARAVGIRFLDIGHVIQEKIISWLFDYQRQLRKRGLL